MPQQGRTVNGPQAHGVRRATRSLPRTAGGSDHRTPSRRERGRGRHDAEYLRVVCRSHRRLRLCDCEHQGHARHGIRVNPATHVQSCCPSDAIARCPRHGDAPLNRNMEILRIMTDIIETTEEEAPRAQAMAMAAAKK